MDIEPGRMVHLGYDKYWRSDDIVGLLPIEEDRGPGRRTEVYVTSRDRPIVASRTEESILEDIASAGEGELDPGDAREALRELVRQLDGLSPVLRRMLRHEGNLDVEGWIEHVAALESASADDDPQEELFPDA